ncbi:MAG TPA: hypothetical protein VF177_05555 [Anaerolineae bacterium]
MHELSFPKKAYFGYLGRVYVFAYLTTRRRFLGIRLSTLITWLTTGLVIVAWLLDWGSIAVVITLVLAIWVRWIYWRARRAGYSRFVPDETAVIPTAELSPLPANQRVHLRATGTFCLSDREEYVLLRPAEYWQVPLGEHIVMVQSGPERFLYQFFNASTLQEVQRGWLVFGSRPLNTLAVTFLGKWGPSYSEYGKAFYVGGGGENSNANLKKSTIYFTFPDGANQDAVWHTIVSDARQARQ